MRAWAYCEAYAFLIPVASTSAREGGDAGWRTERRAAARRLRSLRGYCVWDLLISGREHGTRPLDRERDPATMHAISRMVVVAAQEERSANVKIKVGSLRPWRDWNFNFTRRGWLWRNFSNAGGNRPGTGICMMQGFRGERGRELAERFIDLLEITFPTIIHSRKWVTRGGGKLLIKKSWIS